MSRSLCLFVSLVLLLQHCPERGGSNTDWDQRRRKIVLDCKTQLKSVGSANTSLAMSHVTQPVTPKLDFFDRENLGNSSMLQYLMMEMVCIPMLTTKSLSFRRLRMTCTALRSMVTFTIDLHSNGAYSRELRKLRHLRQVILTYSAEEWDNLAGRNGRISYLIARVRVEKLLILEGWERQLFQRMTKFTLCEERHTATVANCFLPE